MAVEVVDRDGEVVEPPSRPRAQITGRPWATCSKRVSQRIASCTTVAPSAGAQGTDAACLRQCRESRDRRSRGVLELLDVRRRRVRAVREVGFEKRSSASRGRRRSLCHDRSLVPVEIQPAQRVEDSDSNVLRRRALAVGVLDSQHSLAPRARQQPVEQRRARAPSACARRRRSEANLWPDLGARSARGRHGGVGSLQPPPPQEENAHGSRIGLKFAGGSHAQYDAIQLDMDVDANRWEVSSSTRPGRSTRVVGIIDSGSPACVGRIPAGRLGRPPGARRPGFQGPPARQGIRFTHHQA